MRKINSEVDMVGSGGSRIVELATYVQANSSVQLNAANRGSDDTFVRRPIPQERDLPLENSEDNRKNVCRIDVHRRRLEQIRIAADAESNGSERDERLKGIYRHSWLVDVLLDVAAYMTVNELSKPAEAVFEVVEVLMDEIWAE